MSLYATLGAGTCVNFSTNLTTPSWTEIEGALSIGAIGLTAEAKDSTVLKDTVKKNRPGMLEGPDKPIKGQFWSENVNQKAFIAAVKARTPMLIQVIYPDKPNDNVGSSGTIAEFQYQPLGFEMDDATAEEWLMWTANGKQNSEPTWTDPVAA